MHFLLAILLVLLGVTTLWYRERLARFIARLQQSLSRAWPWAYPGVIGRFYTSEKAWRIFIPVLGVAYATFGLLWLWKGEY